MLFHYMITGLVLAHFHKVTTESPDPDEDPAPYYSKSKYFWSFDGLDVIEENINVEPVLGVLENAIRLSSRINGSATWLDLGSINFSCITQPYKCQDGFTVLFWAKMKGDQNDKILVNAAEHQNARGIHLRINQGRLRFSTTGLEPNEDVVPRTVRRYLDAAWDFEYWTHVGLVWNSKSKEMKIFYNCSEADYTSAGILFDRSAHVFDPPQRFIVGANEQLSNNVEAEIDELGIWDMVLGREAICQTFDSRRVHGKYSEWSSFTTCSKTCGEGIKTRSRTCTNPAPRNGGRNCSEAGPSRQSSTCIDVECPVDGGYSLWSKFSECSLSCGGGLAFRIRTCTQPSPQHGGRNCSRLGPARQIRVCNLNLCPVNGGYSAWSNFTSCTKSCNYGTMSRNRSCNNPRPRYNGRNCSRLGPSSEIKSCNEFPCPIHGEYAPWSSFSACSLSCGGGRAFRIRTCTQPSPQHGGRNCSRLGPARQVRVCNLNPCPVNGGYSAWSNFTPCTKSCNFGTMSKNRSCNNPRPRYNGRNCSKLGPSSEIKSCNEFPCPIHGEYGPWSPFSACSLSCGGGLAFRIRTCTQPSPQHGGRDCSRLGPARQVRVCNLNPCPVHGGYSAWTNFTSCTKSCNNGTMSRNRSCNDPRPRYNGRNCSRLGPSSEIKSCNEFPCPIHGGYSSWSSYSTCSLSCGGGQQTRVRHCTNPIPKHGGKSCHYFGASEETRKCNSHPCSIHGGYTEWSNFSLCTKSCGNGTKWRSRRCTNPRPQFGGENCSKYGSSFERVFCNTYPCPVHGNYTQWSNFGSCSVTCNNGTTFRTRTCTNPSPKHSGQNCTHLGPAKEVRRCKLNECPIDGQYGQWSPFSACSVTCGNNGSQIRTRSCDNPAPRFGGRNCSALGPVRQIRACNIIPCPIDGAWGPWSNYSRCSKTCESGRRYRTRKCNSPIPQYGGRNCTKVSREAHEEVEICNTQLCPDVVVEITINMTAEKWKDSLSMSTSKDYRRLTDKILKNVKMFYGVNSSLRKSNVLEIRNGSVLAVLELTFFNRLYSGVMDIQDEIFLRKKLGNLSIRGLKIESKDVPSSPPANITMYNTSSQSIMVTWNQVPLSLANGEISGFTVLYYSAENITSYRREATLESDTLFVELKGLKIFHPYFVRVFAKNRRGDGVPSLPELVWTDMEAPDTAPEMQSGYNLSSTSIFIRWSGIPRENIRGILLGFRLKYKMVNTDQIFRQILNSSSHETIIENLQKFSEYVIHLAGFNRIGSGPETRTMRVKTDEDVPTKPPEDVRARNSSSTSLVVSWKAIPSGFIHGILRGYFVSYKTEYSNVWKNITVGPRTYSVELRKLRKYQKYHIQIAGFTSKGEGKSSKKISVMTDEDVPSHYPPDITAAKTSSTSILVEWDPISPERIHGILLGYRIFYKRRALKNSEWSEWDVLPLSRAAELKRLRKFRKYDIQIAGVTSKGPGVRSPNKIAVTGEDLPSHSVHFVRARPGSSTSLLLHWGRIPRSKVHGILRGYKILYRAIGNRSDIIDVRKAIPFEHNMTLYGLLKFTTYGIRVIGFTIGDGIASEEIFATTDQDRPSKPPHNIHVRSRWSSSTIPVSWEPITPTYYVHGILLGYRIKYKPVKNPLGPITANYKWITVPPDTLTITIEGLTSFTTYAIQVLAFTSKGDGVFSKEFSAETCSCQNKLMTNWWKLTPYTEIVDGKATGIFPAILEKAIEMCCSDCAKQALPKIDFVGSDNAQGLQNGILEVNQNINDGIDFHFPIHGTKSQTSYADGFPYVPMVQSPGAAFLISSANQYKDSSRVMKILLDCWPLVVILVVASYFVGLIMWIIEHRSNSVYFPQSFLYGPWNGFWWAYITVTTVGYGDKTPRTNLGRAITIVWTLVGQVLIVIFVAKVTSQLSASIMEVDVKIYGKKIAVIQNSSEYRLGIKKNAKFDPDKAYSNLQDIYNDLVDHKVFGSLLDVYTVAREQELFNNDKLSVNKIFDYSLQYGVVLGGHTRKLQKCLQNFLKKETEHHYKIVMSHVKPVKNVLSRNVRIDKMRSLFNVDSSLYKIFLITCTSLFGCFTIFGFIAHFVFFHILPRHRRPDPAAVIAEKREKEFRSQQETLINLRMEAYADQMIATLVRTKRRHLKELKSYIAQRKKAEKRIQRALRKERKRKLREEKKGDEGSESDDSISNISSDGSVKKETQRIWRDIEPLEGLFSLV